MHEHFEVVQVEPFVVEAVLASLDLKAYHVAFVQAASASSDADIIQADLRSTLVAEYLGSEHTLLISLHMVSLRITTTTVA